ncbi:MAG TPA: YkgJ family cysteine cluster protein [Hyphomicrobiaceae bacterium]|nr:YkgJ family cysteine cluster protein [Hyphomicrobiaceae bacterium]
MVAVPPGSKERREQRRALIQAGRRAVSQGLPNPVSQSVLIGVGLVLRDKLTARTDPHGASAAAEIATRLADKAIEAVVARNEIACRRGCAFCCHFAVAASPPEVFRLARALRERAREGSTAVTTVIERAQATRDLALEEITRACLPCAMLAGSECSAYEARPITCRQFLSRSAEACERNLRGEPIEIPTLKGAINAGVLCRNLLLAAARSAGLSDDCYELAGALAIALADPGAERRWLSGATVFEGLPAAARPPSVQDMLDGYAALISAWA